MYRQREKMEQIKQLPGESQEQFLTRVSSLPVVTAALGQLVTYYSRAKESHSLLKYTLDTAESSAKIALVKAQPWAQPALNKLPIEAINSIACNQLDKLENRYPIITKPTEQVLDETLVLYKNTLKPSVDKVVAAKDYSVETVSGVQTYTKNAIDGVKGYGQEKVSGAVEYGSKTLQSSVEYGNKAVTGALQTTYGQVLVKKVDDVLDVTDTYVDHYLPEEGDVSEEKPAEVDAVEPANGLTKAVTITGKVRARMFKRAIRELQRVQLRSKETLEKFGFTVDLIQYAKDRIDGVKGRVSDTTDKVKDIWTEINKTEDDVSINDESAGQELDTTTLERRAIVTARHLTSSLKGMMGYLTTTVRVLPETVQQKVSQARDLSDTLYSYFSSTELKVSDIPQVTLDLARSQVVTLQQKLGQISDYLIEKDALSWIMPATVRPYVMRFVRRDESVLAEMDDSDVEGDDTEESDRQGAPDTGYHGYVETESSVPRDDSFNSTQSDFSPDDLSFDDSALEK